MEADANIQLTYNMILVAFVLIGAHLYLGMYTHIMGTPPKPHIIKWNVFRKHMVNLHINGRSILAHELWREVRDYRGFDAWCAFYDYVMTYPTQQQRMASIRNEWGRLSHE